MSMILFLLKYREFLFAKEECLPVFAACVYNSAASTSSSLLYFFLPVTPPSLPSQLSFPQYLLLVCFSLVELLSRNLFMNMENFWQQILDHLISNISSWSVPHSEYSLWLKKKFNQRSLSLLYREVKGLTDFGPASLKNRAAR